MKARDVTQYTDVEEVLDKILDFDQFPSEYSFDTAGEAVNWRHRANNFRLALRHNEECAMELPPGTGTSKYDALIYRISKNAPFIVSVDKRRPTGILSIGGEIIE